MSDFSSNLDTLTLNAQQEPNANNLFNATSPAMLFGRRESTTTGLVWGYYGGRALIGGSATNIANGTVTLTASTTNYVEANNAGTVSKNTTGFTAGSIPLYSVETGTATITSYTDYRIRSLPMNPRVAVSMTSDGNKTLTQDQAAADILDITSSVSLTATRNIVLPLAAKQWTVNNATTGGQSLQFIGASGTGITVATGKRAIVYADGTNIVRVTADQ